MINTTSCIVELQNNANRIFKLYDQSYALCQELVIHLDNAHTVLDQLNALGMPERKNNYDQICIAHVVATERAFMEYLKTNYDQINEIRHFTNNFPVNQNIMQGEISDTYQSKTHAGDSTMTRAAKKIQTVSSSSYQSNCINPVQQQPNPSIDVNIRTSETDTSVIYAPEQNCDDNENVNCDTKQQNVDYIATTADAKSGKTVKTALRLVSSDSDKSHNDIRKDSVNERNRRKYLDQTVNCGLDKLHDVICLGTNDDGDYGKNSNESECKSVPSSIRPPSLDLKQFHRVTCLGNIDVENNETPDEISPNKSDKSICLHPIEFCYNSVPSSVVASPIQPTSLDPQQCHHITRLGNIDVENDETLDEISPNKSDKSICSHPNEFCYNSVPSSPIQPTSCEPEQLHRVSRLIKFDAEPHETIDQINKNGPDESSYANPIRIYCEGDADASSPIRFAKCDSHQLYQDAIATKGYDILDEIDVSSICENPTDFHYLDVQPSPAPAQRVELGAYINGIDTFDRIPSHGKSSFSTSPSPTSSCRDNIINMMMVHNNTNQKFAFADTMSPRGELINDNMADLNINDAQRDMPSVTHQHHSRYMRNKIDDKHNKHKQRSVILRTHGEVTQNKYFTHKMTSTNSARPVNRSQRPEKTEKLDALNSYNQRNNKMHSTQPLGRYYTQISSDDEEYGYISP